MNSKQGSRDLKNEILAHNGIVPDISLEKNLQCLHVHIVTMSME
jgi:hypothetical protein